MNQFQKLMLLFFNLKNISSRELGEIPVEAKRRKEIREIEEMLGLRIPKIKITDPEEEERERKINKIKEINKKLFDSKSLKQPSH